MRFWFNTGWNDEDEAGYVEWATSGFVVQEGNINVSAYDANEPYCDAFEFGFPTLDSRDRWVQRAKESLARWSHKLFGSRRLKYPIAKVYVPNQHRTTALAGPVQAVASAAAEARSAARPV